MDSFLNHFRPSSEAEVLWLKGVFTFIAGHVCPLLSDHTPSAADDTETSFQCRLSVSVVKTIQQRTPVNHTLPVSYRMVSVSELVAQQHMACVSNLSWSTNQHRAWVREAELAHPGLKAVSRVNLLLIGCLREGRGDEWTLTDASGSVRCESLSLSPKCLNRLVFLTHWNYIPQHAPGHSQDEAAGGFVELIDSSVLLWPDPDQGLVVDPGGGAVLRGAVGVREAVDFLQDRQPGRRLSVCGRVSSVCPVLTISGTTFFFFTLTDGRRSLPILVKVGVILTLFCHNLSVPHHRRQQSKQKHLTFNFNENHLATF
ncbi:CST complex subunit CTC1-like [Thalassophryne amazonica]|uniref:CST complex subunit CTC1-like n=1 Tax=Thalassophryne amazonica TaxID=390379 RepID=UPI0014712A48|nr:CST complex subunit CTC1-like [Thalassophryne amazonica]